jgi:hypothetical protein
VRRRVRQKLREIVVFGVLFSLPFAAAFAVEPWAAFLVCPLGVVGLLGLNEVIGDVGGLGVLSRAAPMFKGGFFRASRRP